MDQTKSMYYTEIMNLYKLGNVDEYIKYICNNKISENQNNLAFCYCCAYGNLEIAKWLLDMKPDINIADNNYSCFRMACIEGRLEIIKWLFNMVEINLNNNDPVCSYGLVTACSAGELELAKFFYNDRSNIFEHHYEDSLLQACKNGHLDIIKWLLSVKPDINISANYEAPFRFACYYGYLEVAKWLLEIKPDINISAVNEAFRLACDNDNLEIAKWLFNVKPDIDITIDDHDILYSACKTNKIEIVKWLQTIYPFKFCIEIKDNCISYELTNKRNYVS